MKVLLVHNRHRDHGGEDTVVDAERAALITAGHEVELFEEVNPDGSRDAALRLAQSPWNVGARRRLVEACKRAAPDVVHFHNTWFSLSGSVIGVPRSLGIASVMTLHNYRHVCLNSLLLRNDRACLDCVGGLPWRGVVHGCYRGSRTQSAVAALGTSIHRVARTWNRSLDAVIVLTDFAAGIASDSGIDRKKLVVRPNSCPDPGQRPRPPSGSPTLLFVGRLSAEKGIEPLLDSFAAATTELRLVIVGDGPLAGDLARRAGPNVRFLGRRSPHEVAGLMLDCRALLLPSTCFEGLPMTMIEAMAAGAPVLASDQPTFASFVERQGSSWLVPPGDVAKWSAAIEGMADDDSVDRAGVAARELWAERFRPERSVDHLLEIYREAVSAASARRIAT